MLEELIGSEPIERTAPTFDSKWDRVTYLLSEWKWPLIVIAVSSMIVYASTDTRLPTPPDAAVAFAIAGGLIAMPSYIVWVIVAKKVVSKISVRVIEYGGPNGEVTTYDVPPKTWKARETNLFDAYRAPGTDQWKVWDLEWKDDIDQLEVTGVWPSAADPNDVYKSQKKVEKMFIDMLKELMKAQAFQATVAAKGVDIYDESHKEHLELTEAGILPDGVDAAAKIEELEDEIAGSLDIEEIGEMDGDTGDPDRIDAAQSPEPAPTDAQHGGER
ncbi:hypothetical protein [Halostella salina]|uniref:hypothetical protein n=1 Tax=Halostella salina TaxID=1547897 RepID=UPI000EF779EB|nr:hypothetical protein [Halostella salina]